MLQPPVFKVLFVASEVRALGLSFTPDDFGQGVVVSSMEAPVEARRLQVVVDPNGTGLLVASQTKVAEQYDAIDVGDVLVQIDSTSVWNCEHQQVLSLMQENAGRAHVLYFVDQGDYFAARKAQKKMNNTTAAATDYLLRVTDEVTRYTTQRWWPSLWRSSDTPPPPPTRQPPHNPTASKSNTSTTTTPASRFSLVPQVIRRTFGPRTATDIYNHNNKQSTNSRRESVDSALISDVQSLQLQDIAKGRAVAVAQAQSDADKAFRLEQYRQAVGLYSKAIELDGGKSPNLYAKRSSACLKAGHLDGAVRDAEVCVVLRPEWAMGYFRLGTALEALDTRASLRRACAVYAAGLCETRRNSALSSALAFLLSRLAQAGLTCFAEVPFVVIMEPGLVAKVTRALQLTNSAMGSASTTIAATAAAASMSNSSNTVLAARKVLIMGDCDMQAMGFRFEPLLEQKRRKSKTKTAAETTSIHTRIRNAVLTRAPIPDDAAWSELAAVLSGGNGRASSASSFSSLSDGCLRVGDVIISINGELVSGLSFNEIIIELETATWPTVVTLASSAQLKRMRSEEHTTAINEPAAAAIVSHADKDLSCFHALASVFVSDVAEPYAGEYVPQEIRNGRLVYQNENGVVLSYERMPSTNSTPVESSGGGWVLGLPPFIAYVAVAVDTDDTIAHDGRSPLRQFEFTRVDAASADWRYVGTPTATVLQEEEDESIKVSALHRIVPDDSLFVDKFSSLPSHSTTAEGEAVSARRINISSSKSETEEEEKSLLLRRSFEEFVDMRTSSPSSSPSSSNTNSQAFRPRTPWTMGLHMLAMKGTALRLLQHGNPTQAQDLATHLLSVIIVPNNTFVTGSDGGSATVATNEFNKETATTTAIMPSVESAAMPAYESSKALVSTTTTTTTTMPNLAHSSWMILQVLLCRVEACLSMNRDYDGCDQGEGLWMSMSALALQDANTCAELDPNSTKVQTLLREARKAANVTLDDQKEQGIDTAANETRNGDFTCGDSAALREGYTFTLHPTGQKCLVSVDGEQLKWSLLETDSMLEEEVEVEVESGDKNKTNKKNKHKKDKERYGKRRRSIGLPWRRKNTSASASPSNQGGKPERVGVVSSAARASCTNVIKAKGVDILALRKGEKIPPEQSSFLTIVMENDAVNPPLLVLEAKSVSDRNVWAELISEWIK